MLLAIVCVLLQTACAPPDSTSDLPDKDLQDKRFATGATKGVAALGRTFASVAALAGWYDKVATLSSCKPAEVKRVAPDLVSFYLAPGMAATIAEVGVCEKGYGDVVGLVRAGRMRDFQTAYKRDLKRDPALWAMSSHRLMLGNGFFLIALSGSTPETYGVRYLRCDSDATIAFPREEYPADIPGCALLRKAYGGSNAY
jgi:hypothetical protein